MGTLAPLGWSTSLVSMLRGPVYLNGAAAKGAEASTDEAAVATFELRCAARAVATAGSSMGTLAPLGWSTSLVSMLRGPLYLNGAAAKGAEASTGAEAAIAAFELRCAARALATAGSSMGTLAPLGWSTSLVSMLRGPVYLKGAAPKGAAAKGAAAKGTAAPTGAEAAIAAFELRCAARAEATAGSSAGTLAPLG